MEKELVCSSESFKADILRNSLKNFLFYSERKKKSQGFQEFQKGLNLDYLLMFRDVLEENFNRNRQVAFYANQMFVTKKRLNQATSKILGKTPKQMIDERVVLEAKRLLAHTTESVKEIGFQLGFDEPTNFVKYFRKHCHFTPIEFRESFH